MSVRPLTATCTDEGLRYPGRRRAHLGIGSWNTEVLAAGHDQQRALLAYWTLRRGHLVQSHAYMWRTPPDGTRQPVTAHTLLTAYTHARDPERQATRIRAARSVFWGTQRTRHT